MKIKKKYPIKLKNILISALEIKQVKVNKLYYAVIIKKEYYNITVKCSLFSTLILFNLNRLILIERLSFYIVRGSLHFFLTLLLTFYQRFDQLGYNNDECCVCV